MEVLMKNENLINFGIVNYEIKNSTFNWPNFGEVYSIPILNMNIG